MTSRRFTLSFGISGLYRSFVFLILFIRFIYSDYIIFPESESNKIFRYNISDSFLIQNGTEISPISIASPLAMDVDPVERKIYTTNSQSGTIIRFNFDGSDLEIIRKLNPLNSLTSGVSIDPSSRLLYYGDPGTDTISVMRLDGMYHKELFNENTTKVKAIQVAPELGLLYWTDWGQPPKIERSHMDGTDRTVIIDTKLVMPWSLAVDQIERKLYWGDAKLKKIEVSELDGTGRAVVLETKVIYPFGLALYQDHLVWTDWSQSKLLALKKTERDAHHVIDPVDRLFDKLGDVKIYRDTDAKNALSPINHPCSTNNGGCTQLCFPTPSSGLATTDSLTRICGCQDGSSLLSDSTTCEGYRPLDEFLLVSDSYQAKIMVMDMSSHERHFYLPILEMKRPDAVDYDPKEKFVYWVDEGTKVIRRIHLDPTGPVNGMSMRFLNDLVSNPTGMAIDWLSRLIYYNNAGLKLMAVMDVNGKNHKVLIKNLEDPRAMALDAEAGMLFWNEWGENPSIKSSWGDGTNIKILATEGVSNPTGIVADHQEGNLYWCDARLDKIERMNYDGTNRSVIFFGTSIHPYGIAVDSSFIYWSDWTRSNVLRSPKFGQYNDKLSLGPKVFSRLGTLRVFLKNLTAITNSCVRNGGCSHICFPLPISAGGRRVTCSCPDGLILSNDKRTCSSETEMFERFLIFADGVLPDIFVMNYDDMTKFHLIPGLSHARPAALDYDPVDKFMYWSDVRERNIKRATLDGKGYKVVKQLLPNVSLPDGLTLDPVIRLIYYSDTGRNVISVLSLDGAKHKDIVTENLDEPRAIQLDVDNGYMYWTDWGSHAKIEKAYMDGTHRKTLIEDDIIWPNGLSIDKQNKRLFWVDAKRDTLSSCDFDGGDLRLIVSMVRKHPFALTITPDYFFWTDWITSTVRRLPRVDLQLTTTDGSRGKRQASTTSAFRPKQVAVSSLTSAPTPTSNDQQSLSTTLTSLVIMTQASSIQPTNNASLTPSPSLDPMTSADKVVDITSPTFSRLLDIHAYVGPPKSSSYMPHPCRQPENGGCSDLCFPVPEGMRRVCACSDTRYPKTRALRAGDTELPIKMNRDDIDDNPLLSDGLTCLADLICRHNLSSLLSGPFPPQDIEAVNCGFGRLGSTCEFRCKTGYVKVSGTEIRTCTSKGDWSGSLLKCEGRQCVPINSPANAIIEKCPGTYGTTCHFKCQDGSKYISGDFERTCNSDGTWGGYPLVCQKTSCRYPYLDDENVIASACPTEPKPGSVCHLKCKPGFVPKVGAESAICQDDGTWSQPLLSCHALNCGSLPPSIANSVDISCSDTTAGSVCLRKCPPHLSYISGTKARECLQSGTWSGSDLICSTCHPLAKPARGILECSAGEKSGIGAECKITCDLGAVMIVEEAKEGKNFKCQNTEWLPDLETPSCSELVLPTTVTVSGNLSLKTAGSVPYIDNKDCQDTFLREALTNWLRNSPMLLGCMDSDLCEIKDLKVVCLDSKDDIRFDYRYSFVAVNSLTGRFLAADYRSKTTDAAINVTSSVASFSRSIQTRSFSSVSLIRGSAPFSVDPMGSSLPAISITCQPGHIIVDNHDCAACPAGTMLNKLTYQCTPCPVGEFQVMAGQTFCSKCPTGTSTHVRGSYKCQKLITNASSLKNGNVSSGVALVVFLVLFILIAISIGAFIFYQRRGMKLPSIAKIPLPPKLTGRGKADQQEMTNVPYENF
ncbi:unnamed protein product [Gordionus sp. m RMFG-2023]|uniref:low-density lipoprotein receptor-related protein 2-like n=1 Tax=Gordionus sp. m RMFG-2023 TaxID=3053472 RepID=UPI0030DEEE63